MGSCLYECEMRGNSIIVAPRAGALLVFSLIATYKVYTLVNRPLTPSFLLATTTEQLKIAHFLFDFNIVSSSSEINIVWCCNYFSGIDTIFRFKFSSSSLFSQPGFCETEKEVNATWKEFLCRHWAKFNGRSLDASEWVSPFFFDGRTGFYLS